MDTNHHLKYFGVAYYPEHWQEDRWPEDARLMRKAGFNVVRLAEFAWSKMEPSEGRFDFEWLRKAVDILYSEGIEVVLGTPTAAAPAWLMEAHPEIYRVNDQRQRLTFGARQFMCINAPAFRSASRRIVTAMAIEFGKHPAVIGWQIDNEFGPLCYCEVCQRAFQNWLEAKYGNLDALNNAWGTTFWSQIYTDWTQIPLPWATSFPVNPGLYLDYRRFMTDSYVSFQREQIDIIRQYSPGRFVTHNFMGFFVDTLDYYKLAADLDFVSWDNYPQVWNAENPAATALSPDYMRGMKHKAFWIMEQQSGPGGWGCMGPSPLPGKLREWTREAVTRGAEGVVYFRWRPARVGIEQYWHGILNHDGSLSRRYEEIKQIGEEIRKNGVPSMPNPEIALLVDPDSRFAFQLQPCNERFSYFDHVLLYYQVLYDDKRWVDVIPADSNLSNYKLVIAPSLYVLREDVADSLARFVYDGGILVTTFRSGVKDKYSRIVDKPLPGLLREVCGVEVEEYHSPLPGETGWVRGLVSPLPLEPTSASVWFDILRPITAEPVAEYVMGYGAGHPAITLNRYGNGLAFYIGTWIEKSVVKGCLDLADLA
jgi:beta-galactosidase